MWAGFTSVISVNVVIGVYIYLAFGEDDDGVREGAAERQKAD